MLYTVLMFTYIVPERCGFWNVLGRHLVFRECYVIVLAKNETDTMIYGTDLVRKRE